MIANSIKDIVIYGAGGFGMEVAWLIEDINKVEPSWNLLGYIDDDKAKWGRRFYGYVVLGGMNYLESSRGDLAIAIAMGNPLQRKLLVTKLMDRQNISFPSLIHPSVIMSHSTQIGNGVIIAASSILTVEIVIGQHVHINLDCTVGHGALIEPYCTLFPSVNISGNVILRSCVSIGTGTSIIQGLEIGTNSVVGAGAVVIRDVEPDTVVVGNPARPIP